MVANVFLQKAVLKIIETHYRNFDAMDVADETVVLAPTRLDRVEEVWREFVNNDNEMRLLTDYNPTHAYFTDDTFYEAQGIYDLVKSKYFVFIQANTVQIPNISPPVVTASHANFTLDLGLLVKCPPQITPPTFSGDATEWPNFWDMFLSLIYNQDRTTNVVKLTYLRAYLKGEALDVIKSIPITDANYDSAWDTLKSYFENEYQLDQSYVSDLFYVKPMTRVSFAEIKRVLNEVFTSWSSHHVESVN